MSSVYKFRSNIDIRKDTFSLLDNKIYASNLKDLNDPFETTIINYLIKHNSKKEQSPIEKLLDRIKIEVGIYSTSCDSKGKQIVKDELMWAHYANAHRGFCIEYDLDILCDSLKLDITDNVDLITVKYDELNIKDYIVRKSKGNIKETLLGQKSPRWEYENEIRLVFDSWGIKMYDPKALKGVYFGFNMPPKDREIIMKGLEGVNVTFYEMKIKDEQYELYYERIKNNDAYMRDRLPSTMYEIIGEPKILKTVQNFNVLYKSEDKSSNMIKYFVSKFREEHAFKPSNITIVDDKRVIELIDSVPRAQWTKEENDLIANHWIAYSTFDAPEYVWMYPER